MNNATITLELSNDELTALAGLLDAGVKAAGLQGVKSAAALLIKLEEAVAKTNAQIEEPKTTKESK